MTIRAKAIKQGLCMSGILDGLDGDLHAIFGFETLPGVCFGLVHSAKAALAKQFAQMQV